MDILFTLFLLLGVIVVTIASIGEHTEYSARVLGVFAGLLLLALGGGGLTLQRLAEPQVLVVVEDDPVKREVSQLLEQPTGAPLRQIIAQYEPRCAARIDQRFPLAVVMGVSVTQHFPRHCAELTAADRAQIEALTATLSQPL